MHPNYRRANDWSYKLIGAAIEVYQSKRMILPGADDEAEAQ